MKEDKQKNNREIVEEIIEAIEKIKYGEIVITVYNSKIVQIEEKKKKRFS